VERVGAMLEYSTGVGVGAYALADESMLPTIDQDASNLGQSRIVFRAKQGRF
jgi:hypothetical protein